MNKPAVIALVITLLDAMGIGLIMPVLPSLLREYLRKRMWQTITAFCWRCMR